MASVALGTATGSSDDLDDLEDALSYSFAGTL